VRGFLKHFAPDEFRPDEISILEDAFEDAWRRVECSKALWSTDDYAAAGRTIVAKYIITMAKGGAGNATLSGLPTLQFFTWRNTNSPADRRKPFNSGLQFLN
jgi:hypothetical protein